MLTEMWVLVNLRCLFQNGAKLKYLHWSNKSRSGKITTIRFYTNLKTNLITLHVLNLVSINWNNAVLDYLCAPYFLPGSANITHYNNKNTQD